MANLLEVKNLSVDIKDIYGTIHAVRDVSFSLQEGEVLAIVGESGSGKSVLCKAIMGLLPPSAHVTAERIELEGNDITNYGEGDMKKLRGRVLSMVFQDPSTSLNPTMSIGSQIAEAVKIHDSKLSKKEVSKRVLELLELVGIDRGEARQKLYPCHLSGGMRQRCVLAIALASRPRILFADEPTTALDVTIQAQILELLCNIQKKIQMSTVFVTHDLGVVARVADRVAIMYAGKIVEIGKAEEIFYTPRHPYTWGLLRSLPILSRGKRELPVIPGQPPSLINPPKGDAFACRNPHALAIDYEEMPPFFRVTDTHFAATWLLAPEAPKISFHREGEAFPYNQQSPAPLVKTTNGENGNMSGKKLLEVSNLTHIFPLSKGIYVKALDDVSFDVDRGEIFGLVGESGSGKSTLARCIMNIHRPYNGRISYQGIETTADDSFRRNKKLLQTSRQMIFQNSNSSLNQRMKVADIVAEPLLLAGRMTGTSYLEAVGEALMQAGLSEGYLNRYPSQLSGGERQRVAIARAIIMNPELIVADEPIASLDVSMQAQMVNLFHNLQRKKGFTFIFIAHDLSMVEFLCNRVGVLYKGRLVELAETGELFQNPLHPYTKTLLTSIPIPDPVRERERRRPVYSCEQMDIEGELFEISPGHFVRGGIG